MFLFYPNSFILPTAISCSHIIMRSQSTTSSPHLNINQFLENNLFRNRSVLISSSYPCHLIYRTKIDFHYQKLSANFFEIF